MSTNNMFLWRNKKSGGTSNEYPQHVFVEKYTFQLKVIVEK